VFEGFRVSVEFKSGLHVSRRIVLIVLLLVVLLVCSCLVVYVLVDNNAGGSVHVKSEVELRKAIAGVQFGESVVIVLDCDISLIGTITVPVGVDVTLQSNGGVGFFKLFGPNGDAVLGVEGGGVLRLNGVVVTHASGDYGRGVWVNSGGKLVLYDGEISNNNDAADVYGGGNGGGVYNDGIFEMYGGVISGNVAPSGGGVCNSGTFSMFGGEISGNTATYPYRSNSIGSGGGGVHSRGVFSMYGGVISGNTAGWGGGVYLNGGSFELLDGVISGNVAVNAGGVYHNWGTFNVEGGVISGNVADVNGDVYNYKL